MATGVVGTLTWGDLEPIRTAANAAATGLTWTATATLVNDGTTTAAMTMTEIGSTGRYRPSFTPTAVGVWALEYNATIDGVTAYFSQSVTVKTAAKDDPAASITALYGAAFANLDATVSSRATTAAITAALGNAAIVVVSPIQPASGNVTVYQGDDQVDVASRSLKWVSSNSQQWPDLTGALSIVLQGDLTMNRAHQVTATGSVVTPTGADKQVMVELDRDATMALREGTYDIQVIATLADGNVETLVDAEMQVVRRKGA